MENQTLTIVLTLVSLLCSVALFINWAGNKHIPGLFQIALGFTITSAGILLLTAQGNYSPWIAVMLANGMILVGRIPLLIGLSAFWHQEDNKLPVIASMLFALTMSAFYYFTFIEESIISRIRIYTSLMVVFDLCFLFVIAKGLRVEQKSRPVMTVSANFGAFLALMLFSFSGVTDIVLMFVRTGAPIMASDEGTSIMLLGNIFTMIVLSFAIIIMTMEELNIEHKENAIYDPITSILNHRTFLEVGNRVMGIALRYSKPVSLLTIEIENMDDVVKKYGYKIGNEMLRHFSLMASDRRRNEDVLARSSFKEFRMLLPGVDEEGCHVVIEKVHKALKAEQFAFDHELMDIKVNVSAVTKREEDLDLQQMLQEGEVELYRIKMAAETPTA